MDEETIRRALEDRRILEVVYAGGEVRVVQPHAILRKPDGTELLEAYQIRGGTETGAEHGWKHFDLARIERAELLDERFEPRRDFRPVSGQSGTLVAQVRVDEASPLRD